MSSYVMGTYSGGASYQPYLRVEETDTSIEANTSTVTVTFGMYKAKYNSQSYNANPKTITIVINGVTYYRSAGFDFRSADVGTYNDVTSVSGITIAHNSDGSKSLALSATHPTNIALATGTVNGSVELSVIPRASSLTVPAVTLGDTATLTVDRKSSNFTHSVSVTFGTLTEGIVLCTKSTDAAIAWSPAVNLAQYITEAASADATYTITTYNGDTVIGANTVVGTVSVPATVVPSVSGVAFSDAGQTTFSVFIKGLSKLKAKITAQTAYGSAIVNYQMTVENVTCSNTSDTVTAESVLSGTGAISVTLTVTDGRGRTGSLTQSVTVYNYYAPVLQLDLNSSGTTLMINYTWAVADVNKLNSKSLSIKVVKPSTGTTKSYTPSLSDYSGTKTLSVTLSDLETETYNVTATLKDKLSSMEANATTGVTAFSLYAGGKGAAFFKKAETEGLNVGGNTTIEGDLSVGGSIITPTISGNTSITGDLTVTGTITGGGTMDYLPLSGGTITGDLLINGNFKRTQNAALFAYGSGSTTSWYLKASNVDTQIYKSLVFLVRTFVNNGNQYMTWTIPPIVDSWGLMIPYGASDYFRAKVAITSAGTNLVDATFSIVSSGYSTYVFIYAIP